MSNSDETAKWYISERIALAEALARIEESLKRQDEQLDDLIMSAKASMARMGKMDRMLLNHEGKLSMHEKVAGAVIATITFVTGTLEFLFHRQ